MHSNYNIQSRISRTPLLVNRNIPPQYSIIFPYNSKVPHKAINEKYGEKQSIDT